MILIALLAMQLDHHTDHTTLCIMATGDDEKAKEAQRILKARAKAGEQKYQPEGFSQRLCVRCDAPISNEGPNTCPRCSPQP